MDLSERRQGVVRRHPWEQARADLLITLLRRADAATVPVRMLDIGAGDGWSAAQIAAALHPGSSIVCWDPNYSDADLAELTAGAGHSLTFTRDRPAGTFDWLLLLDVVEHVADDSGFVRDVTAVHLRAGGHLLVTVPAWQRLYSQHDVALRHFRRYAPTAFRDLIESAGIEVERDGGMFTSLLVPRAIAVLRETRNGGSHPPTAEDEAEPRIDNDHGVGVWRGGPALTAAITSALRAEVRLAELMSRGGLRIPGLSCWVMGRRL